MKTLLFIGSGSFIGGVSRYLLSTTIQERVTTAFPFGTLLVNITGCFLIGLLFALFDKNTFSHDWRLFLMTGILGGFTTFSAFSNETVTMFRDGQLMHASLYIAGSIILGLLATVAGMVCVR